MKNLNITLLIICSALGIALIGCNHEEKNSASKTNIEEQIVDSTKINLDEKTNKSNKIEPQEITQIEKLSFAVPPPSGYGSGVCSFDITINGSMIIGTETCGGHDEYGHTESSKTIFKIKYIKNHKYKVSDLVKTEDGSSIACEYFEIKSNKLYLYDGNLNIINDVFCSWGNKVSQTPEYEPCDCIFNPM
jgi:hypothetical protein